TAFPQGAQLTSDSVTVTDGAANVDLNSTAGSVSDTTLSRMELQLSQSLASVAGITDVRISIEGAQLPSSSPLPNPPIQNPSVDSNALVLRAGKFGLLSGTSVTEIPDVSPKVESIGPRAATLSADHRTAAVLGGHANFVVKSTADAPVSFDSRPGLIAPTLDPQGYAWSATSSKPSEFVVLGPTGPAFDLSAAWPDARSLIAVAMSRDGTRLAALVRTDSSTDIMAAGVVRSSAGRPSSVAAPVDLGPVTGGKATSLSWLNDLSVGALTMGSASDSTINVQTAGGDNELEPGPSSGASLGPVGASPYYWVLTTAGSLQWPRGTGWQQRVDGVQFVGQQLGKPQ
ncbi:MAG: LpqB family beta-propeller domain-containing protein, partial [Humibacter sp.]